MQLRLICATLALVLSVSAGAVDMRSFLQHFERDTRHMALGQAIGSADAATKSPPMDYAAALTLAVGLLLSNLVLAVFLYMARKDLKKEQARTRALRNKLKHNAKVLKKEKRDIKTLAAALKDEEKRRYDAVLARNAVRVEQEGGLLALARPLVFGEAGTFSNPADAKLILDDLAELFLLFPSMLALVEAHSKASTTDAFEYEIEIDLALARAELVKAELCIRGVEEYRLDAVGLPGALGRDEEGVWLVPLKW